MSAVLTAPGAVRRVRVAVLSGDSLGRAALAALVSESGHLIAEAVAGAEVVIVDTSVALPAHHSVLSLGGAHGSDAAGVLPRHASAAQIGAAVQALAAGLSVRARDADSGPLSASADPPAQELLTPRELQVLEHLVHGLSNKAIARQLAISQHTVKFHVEALFRKLGVRSRSQAVARGLVRLSQARLDV
jgi:DNA-binding NarL/FixJ family response regulator